MQEPDGRLKRLTIDPTEGSLYKAVVKGSWNFNIRHDDITADYIAAASCHITWALGQHSDEDAGANHRRNCAWQAWLSPGSYQQAMARAGTNTVTRCWLDDNGWSYQVSFQIQTLLLTEIGTSCIIHACANSRADF